MSRCSFHLVALSARMASHFRHFVADDLAAGPPADCVRAGGHGLTDILYQRDGEIIALVPPDPAVAGTGLIVCGAGGRYPSAECGLMVL